MTLSSDTSNAAHLSPSQVVGYSFLCTALVLFSGLMSGLTLGLLSLDAVDLEVLKRSGTDIQKKHAAAVAPLVKKGHQLLVTLLLMNAAAMETLPLFLDQLTNPVGAILISVTMVLVFGEIVPQAICQRFGLAVGFNTRYIVWVLLWVASPLAIPLAKLLDRVLGKEEGMLFRRPQLKALVDLHGAEGGHGGDLTMDETTIISGALDMSHKTVASAMTPMARVRSVSLTTPLTWETLQMLMSYGHSRLPVHLPNDPSAIVGLILVKELFAAMRLEDLQRQEQQRSDGEGIANGDGKQPEPHRPRTIEQAIKLRPIPRMNAETPLYTALNYFQTGRSHMAVITHGKTVLYLDSNVAMVPSPPSINPARVPSFEHELRREGSGGVAAIAKAVEAQTLLTPPLPPSGTALPPSLPPRLVRTNRASVPLPVNVALGTDPLSSPLPASVVASSSAATTPIIINIHDAVVTGDGMPSAVAGSASLRGAPTGPVDTSGQVLGVLTLEDVLEELLQEEILDETDVGVRGESLPFTQADHRWS